MHPLKFRYFISKRIIDAKQGQCSESVTYTGIRKNIKAPFKSIVEISHKDFIRVRDTLKLLHIQNKEHILKNTTGWSRVITETGMIAQSINMFSKGAIKTPKNFSILLETPENDTYSNE